MILYLVGISCVGKSTIGKLLADKIGFKFYDLDEEIERYYNKSVERIQNECFTMNAYREKGSVVLDTLFSNIHNAVIAGTPSGLKFAYLPVYKKHKASKELYSIHIKDTFENVLDRLTFYDIDSNPVIETMDESLRIRYLKDIKEDYYFFKDSYNRADLTININNICLEEIPNLIIDEFQKRIRINL